MKTFARRHICRRKDKQTRQRIGPGLSFSSGPALGRPRGSDAGYRPVRGTPGFPSPIQPTESPGRQVRSSLMQLKFSSPLLRFSCVFPSSITLKVKPTEVREAYYNSLRIQRFLSFLKSALLAAEGDFGDVRKKQFLRRLASPAGTIKGSLYIVPQRAP